MLVAADEIEVVAPDIIVEDPSSRCRLRGSGSTS
jgi:hypothetical protein